MNGSRSNNPGYGNKSSLDQLNRTIEGLEARIQGLMTEKSAPRHSAPNPVDEIIERQRSLGSTRERVSALMERGRTEPRQSQQPAWTDPQPRAAAPAAADPALAEIAATLSALRNEMKHGLGDSLQANFGELRNEMRSLRSNAANPAGIDQMRDELALLHQTIAQLENTGRHNEIGNLQADLDELRAMLSGVAREDSVRHLEKRWDSAERSLAAINPDAVKEELVNLAWRIDGLKSGLGELSAAPAVRALEDKLIAVANAVEAVGRNIQSQPPVAEQFAGLEQRLDEISRAIAATQRQGSVLDTSTLQRVEQRINDLADHIGSFQQTGPADEIADRIEELTARIEQIASEDAARKLEDRIARLSALVESSLSDRAPQVIDSHLADISRKIDGLGGNGAADLIDRLEMLSHKIDQMEHPAPVAMPGESEAMLRLENRLADIAARLDETASAPATDSGALKSLERQITSLSALINQPGAPVQAAAFPEGFDRRMSAIEDYIASSDEFIVEAARQAAETVVEAYSRGGQAPAGASASDMAALAALADDLRSLEAHTRSSEERTQATFEALHETLVQIAGRLNDFGTTSPAPVARVEAAPQPAQEPVREMRERLMDTVAMPKAAQPDFSAASALLEPVAPSRKPENPKVDVFDETELLQPAETVVEEVKAPAVEAVAAKEAKQSKSLIAGLAARLKPAKKERVAIEPAPALDPGPAVVADEPNMLLEPGAGVPDVKKILEKVRNGQQSSKRDAIPVGSPNDMIAAARRAAQAAAAEAGAQKLATPAGFKKPGEKKESKSLFAGLGESRRPILLAAGAILLVAMSYPLVSNLISGGNSDTVAPTIVNDPASQPVDDSAAAPVDQPAATTEQPAATLDQPADALQPEAAVTPDAETTQTNPTTAAETLMQPAENADQASTLVTPTPADADASPDVAEADTEQTADATRALEAAPTDAKPADTQQDMASAPAVEVPAGLQPASLAEAVKKGDALAYFELGARYTDGRGVKVDLAEAAKWYALASDKGLAPAEYRLANLFEKGTGVERDIDKAKALYKSAADKGNASAMHNLAVLMATGVGGTPDFAAAAAWFQKAADLNVRDSQFNLAILFARGNGVQQDLEESYKWFAVAAREGDQDAAQKRDEVANALSPEQLKNAKAKLDLWKPAALDDAANTPMVPDEWIAKGNTTATIDVKRAIRNIQAILNNNGFDAGKPDGEMGKKTVAAIKAFQKSVGQEPSGKITDALVKELLARNKKG